MLRLAVLLLVSLGAAATPAPASASPETLRAPGRVVVPADPLRIQQNPDAGGTPLTVMFPDGDARFLSRLDDRGLAIHRLLRDGSVDPAAVPLPELPGSLNGFLRAPDGRLTVVLGGEAAANDETGPLLVMRLTADGRLDRTYGRDGVATPGINVGCGSCDDVAIAADGSVLLAGMTGSVMPRNPADPNSPSRSRWVVARLDPSGRRDAGFGDGGVATIGPEGASGHSVAVLSDGRVVTRGYVPGPDPSSMALTRLTTSGSPDPGFNAGALVMSPISGFAWLVRDDGTVDVAGTARGPADARGDRPLQRVKVARYTASGQLDGAFGSSGVAETGLLEVRALFGEPGGGVLAYGHPALSAFGPEVGATRLGGDGRIDPAFGTRTVTPAFGGGIDGGRLGQNSFGTLFALRRPDGSFLVPGGVAVVRYTGEGEGYSTGAPVFVSLTPAFALDPAFGGAPAAPSIRLRVPPQRAGRRLVVELQAEAPSLCEVRATAGGRLVASRVIAMFSDRRRRWTIRSRRALPAGATVTVTARVRDLAGTTATARRRVGLR